MAFRFLASCHWTEKMCNGEILYSLLDNHRRNFHTFVLVSPSIKALTSAWRVYLRCLTFTQARKSKPTDV
jgi:hypothetical protein